MKHLLHVILLVAVITLITAGCIQPPTENITENGTVFNLSAVERDSVREAAAEAVHFADIEILEKVQDPEYLEYKQFMNHTKNATYFDYLVMKYPGSYRQYHAAPNNMSFIMFLERYYTNYPYSLNHDYQFVPFRLYKIDNPDHSVSVSRLTRDEIENKPILRSYFIDAPGYGLKVLPSEEWQLSPYRGSCLEWNGTYYLMNRAIA